MTVGIQLKVKKWEGFFWGVKTDLNNFVITEKRLIQIP
jgi:hypothetical protein